MNLMNKRTHQRFFVTFERRETIPGGSLLQGAVFCLLIAAVILYLMAGMR